MLTWNRPLWRLAQRLHAAYKGREASPAVTELPADVWADVIAEKLRLEEVERRGWKSAAAEQREHLACKLERLIERIHWTRQALAPERFRPAPTITDLYEELCAVASEFGDLMVEEPEIFVTSESIRLEDIDLGSFEIRLDLRHIGDEVPYRVVAVTPNPAASSSDVTHPHVKGESLCPGDGRVAIAAALAEGRLCDFFTIVDRILQTYGAGSAYVDLDRWQGTPCHDCDYVVDEDEVSSCRGCDAALCSECLTCCGQCSTGYCSACIDRCPQCDEPHCANCLIPCRQCQQSLCNACLEGELCPDCLEKLANEERKLPETTSSVPTGPEVQS